MDDGFEVFLISLTGIGIIRLLGVLGSFASTLSYTQMVLILSWSSLIVGILMIAPSYTGSAGDLWDAPARGWSAAWSPGHGSRSHMNVDHLGNQNRWMSPNPSFSLMSVTLYGGLFSLLLRILAGI